MADKNSYMVTLTNKKSQRVFAYGYSEKGDKYFFHDQEDLQDFETFFLTKKVKSIIKEKPPEDAFPVSIPM